MASEKRFQTTAGKDQPLTDLLPVQNERILMGELINGLAKIRYILEEQSYREKAHETVSS